MDFSVAYLKFLTAENAAPQINRHFDYTSYLPTDNGDGTYTPGPWLPPVKGDLELCGNGYHSCRLPDALRWADAVMTTIEPGTADGEQTLTGDDKSCHTTFRFLSIVTTWNAQTARLFACDCAEHVLPILEKEDAKAAAICRNTIAVARRFARGDATQEELDAARAAARAAEIEWQMDRLQKYLRGEVS